MLNSIDSQAIICYVHSNFTNTQTASYSQKKILVKM